MYNGEKVMDSHMNRTQSAGLSTGFLLNGEEKAVALRCLVVDDNTTIMQVVARILGAIGYRVDTAEDGPKAL